MNFKRWSSMRSDNQIKNKNENSEGGIYKNWGTKVIDIITLQVRTKYDFPTVRTMTIRAMLISTALVAVSPAFAHAGAPETNSEAKADGELTDIVVTANRREENLQKVPIAISDFSGKSLAQSGITNITEIGTLVPGVVLSTVVGYAQPYVRGVGTSATEPGFENPIATYIDGVYYAAQSGGWFRSTILRRSRSTRDRRVRFSGVMRPEARSDAP